MRYAWAVVVGAVIGVLIPVVGGVLIVEFADR